MAKPLDVKYLYYAVNGSDEPSVYKATTGSQGLLLFSWQSAEKAKAMGEKIAKELGLSFLPNGPRLTSSKTHVAYEIHSQHE